MDGELPKVTERSAATLDCFVAAALELIDLSTFLDIVRTLAIVAGAIAAWSIPRIIASRAAARDRKAASLELAREIKNSEAMLERLARTNSYRRWEAGVAGYLNPYENSYYSFEHDLICILNFFDAACATIDEGYVDKEIIKLTSADMIVGSYSQIEILDRVLVGDQKPSFPHLEKLGKEWADDVPESERQIPNLEVPTQRQNSKAAAKTLPEETDRSPR